MVSAISWIPCAQFVKLGCTFVSYVAFIVAIVSNRHDLLMSVSGTPDRLCDRLQTQRSWVPFPAVPHFLSSSGSGTGSTQPLRG
jgi:hypothetical protein